jgi:tRNA nucleotidyltransferase/poly(A) polymerase
MLVSMPEIRKPFEMVLPEDLYGMALAFKQAGHQLYVVGGAVRDAVLGVQPKDFDVATDATPDQVLGVLWHIRDWKTDEVGKSFGVVKARLDGGDHEYEVATFRQDVGSGRRPESVVFTSIEEDVKRRDLTINALFYDIMKCELVDLVGGLADIDACVVRTVGDPYARFAEDRLRVLRAIRFATKLGYSIDPATYAAILHDPNLNGVSAERIHDELVRAFGSTKSVSQLVNLLSELNMWCHVLPGLRVTPRDIHTHMPSAILAVLLDGEDEQRVARRLLELKYSSKEIAQVTFLLRFRDLEPSKAHGLRKAFYASHMTIETFIAYVFERGLPSRPLVSAFHQYLDAAPVGGDQLLKEGFTGRALGEELERRETEVFRRLVW